MAYALKIIDKALGVKEKREMTLHLVRERVLVRELIEARVRQEVAAFNSRRSEYYHGLVKPTDAEVTLNGFKMKKHRVLDPEKQCYVALDAFMKNGFFILADEKQVANLDDEILIAPKTKVTFIKLVPLVGG